MGSQVEELADGLARAIKVVLDPFTSAADRRAAQTLCEEFKEKSEASITCGLVLASTRYDGPTRHFGLQLIEHCIRRQWNNLAVSDKVLVKESAMRLAAEVNGDVTLQQPYYKDALSRVIVEMIKREWPQQWPTLWPELGKLCSLGPAQTELVMYILLRLVEDVVSFQNVPPQRRRDIQQTLTTSLPDILCFLLDTIVSAASKYRDIASNASCDSAVRVVDGSGAGAYLRLARSALQTASGYVEWAPLKHLAAASKDDNGVVHFLRTLCTLLKVKELQAVAAECLLALASRKGAADDRRPLLWLFEGEALSAIFDSANAAVIAAERDDHSYTYLKLLCQLLVAMGNQLCCVWGTVPGIQQPVAFDQYLNAVLFFTNHPSQLINEMSFSLWPMLLRNTGVSCCSGLSEAVLLQLLSAARSKLAKFSHLTHDRSHPSCHYSRRDFDSDDDFGIFFSRLRTGIADTIRLCSSLKPVMTFRFVAAALGELMLKPMDHGADGAASRSLAAIEWDSMAAFLEGATPKQLHDHGGMLLAADGALLLRQALAYETKDPVIFSSQLSCLSALFPFVEQDVALLPLVLQKMFAAVHFELEGQTRRTRSRSVSGLRWHACYAIVKICKLYPRLMLSMFSELHNYIVKITEDEVCSSMEICALREALIIISNELNDFDKQSAYVGELMSGIPAQLADPKFGSCLDSEALFVEFIGLSKSPQEQEAHSVCNANRSKVLYCIGTILAVTRRSRCPSESVGQCTSASSPVDVAVAVRHPAASHVLPLVPHILRLVRLLGGHLLRPDVLPLWHSREDLAFVVDLPEAEKRTLLGMRSSSYSNDPDVLNCKTASERMQSFLYGTYETCLYILAACCHNITGPFYANLDVSMLLSCVCSDLGYLPDFKLRMLLRIFMKAFAVNCPAEFADSLLLPALDTVLPHAFQILNRWWDIIKQRTSAGDGDDGADAERREIIEEQLLRCLSRDCIDLLSAVCVRHAHGASASTDDHADVESAPNEAMDGDEIETSAAPAASASGGGGAPATSGAHVNEIAASHPQLMQFALWSATVALSWSDTSACSKAAELCNALFRQVTSDTGILASAGSGEEASILLHRILQGLHIHGQHEFLAATLSNTALALYEPLRARHPGLAGTLLQIPGVSESEINTFDKAHIFGSSPGSHVKSSDKKKKDAFRKLISLAIGKNIGQMFRNEEVIRNLPRLVTRRPRGAGEAVLDAEAGGAPASGLCELFRPVSGTAS